MRSERRTVVLALVSVLCAGFVHSASVVWNQAGVSKETVWGGGPYYCVGGESYSQDRSMNLLFVIEGGTGGWIASEFCAGTCTIRTRMMSAGDVVDLDSMFGPDKEYFYVGSVEPYDFSSDYAINPIIYDKVFLGFAAEAWSDTYEVYTVYGWIELNVAGEPSVISSAWDMDGGGMIVGGGAIPEPSSGLMVLFGLAVLGLRRKHDA